MRFVPVHNSHHSYTTGLIVVLLVIACLNISFFIDDFQVDSTLCLALGNGYNQEEIVSIQKAINEAEVGSTVYVPSGIYNERIVINKTIILVGENVSTTIIDGNYGGTVVAITADNVTITGFTIQNSGWGWTKNGIYVHFADNCRIIRNYLFNNCHNIRLNYSRNSQVLENRIDGVGYGIRLINSFDCMAIGNNVSNCIGGVHLQNATICTVRGNWFSQNDQGIRLYSPCMNNMISANMVYKNNYDGMIEAMPRNTTFLDNAFFHNNFMNNTHPFIYKVSGNIWDEGYPSGGNFWSRYNGTDFFSGPHQNATGNDGIGDTPYAVGYFEFDRYPLMHPWSFLPVHNINTGIGYSAIQDGIDANETLNRHVLWVASGVYYEHVIIHKSLALLGEDQLTTILDGGNVGTVLSVNADNVSVIRLTVCNSGSSFPPYGDDCGVLLDHTVRGTISQCLIVNNRIGIYVLFSTENFIEDNIVSSNKNGIWLWYSGNNVLTDNNLSNNSYNFGVFGDSLLDFSNIVDASNLVDEKTVQYRVGAKDETFENQTDIGVLYLINCNNVTVRNLNLTRNGHGVFCYNVTDSRIEDVIVMDNNYGIFVQKSSHNIISRNRCLENWVGIRLWDSDYNVVEMNVVANCEKGISLREANYNVLEGNTVLENIFGIRLDSSSFSRVFHNNLVENTLQADVLWAPLNDWDNGFEGNYWSHYNGSDVAPRDGLGDAALVINNGIQDDFPLLGIFNSFEVDYEGNFYNINVTSNSTLLKFSFNETLNTIMLTVNGTDGTYGFCRVSVPHVLIEPEINVIIDGGLTEVLHPNYYVYDDGYNRWIYFAYEHSTHEILIVPEFTLVLFISALIVASLGYFLRKTLVKEEFK